MSKKIPSTKKFLTTFLHLLCERPETLGTILSVIRKIKNSLFGVFSFVFNTFDLLYPFEKIRFSECYKAESQF